MSGLGLSSLAREAVKGGFDSCKGLVASVSS